MPCHPSHILKASISKPSLRFSNVGPPPSVSQVRCHFSPISPGINLLYLHHLVIDLARLVIGFSPKTYEDANLRKRFFDALFFGAEWQEKWAVPIPKMRETNMLLLLRALANAFQEDAVIGNGAWVTQVCLALLVCVFRGSLGSAQIFDKLGEAPYTVFTKQPRIALSTILFKYVLTNFLLSAVSDVYTTQLLVHQPQSACRTQPPHSSRRSDPRGQYGHL